MTNPGLGGNVTRAPGRTCPHSYRYRPSVFNRPPMHDTETLYVIGGLYGNVEALSAVLAMKQAEERRGHAVTLCFNGDFNWFNVDAESFVTINESVLAHVAIQGNVEAELAENDSTAGCGCAYPSYVSGDFVDRSNRIMERLRAQTPRFPGLIRKLALLPMHATIGVGGERIGIVHGDPESLAGWAFAVENMPPGAGRRHREPNAAYPITPRERIGDYFHQAHVRAFCCAHTCLPFAQVFRLHGQDHLVINNGAAGMPNFAGTTHGLLTRVSAQQDSPDDSLYSIELGTLRFDAVPIRYDQAAWLRRFETNWPPGSPAHESYFRRITAGPDFDIARAVRTPGAGGTGNRF